MDKTGIILDYNPFTKESRIHVMQEDKKDCLNVSSNIDEIASIIVGLSYQNNIYNVFTHAPFAITSEISNAINEYERNKYSNNKIKVEGI